MGTTARRVIQVLAEAAGADLGLQVAVGGGEHADVHLDALGAADALERLVLQGADDLAPGSRAACR